VYNVLCYVVGIGTLVGLILLYRSRHGWRVQAAVGALAAISLMFFLVAAVRAFVLDPSFGLLFLIAVLVSVPALFLALLWMESSPPDPFSPVRPEIIESFRGVIVNSRLRAFISRRRPLGEGPWVWQR